MKDFIRTIVVSILLTSICGCSAFRVSIDNRNPEEGDPLTAHYDQRDMLVWGKQIANDILEHQFMKQNEKPVIADMGIQNRTKTHLDMQSLSDTITTPLLDSGKIRFVNTQDRDKLLQEQGYQLANCSLDTRVKIAKQLSAKFMITGSLVEMEHESGRQVRVSKQQDIYYQLTIKITDLESGEVIMAKQRDRLRRASKPLIGW